MESEEIIEENGSFNSDEESLDMNENDHTEIKEDMVDLTVHCEPTLIEEEEDVAEVEYNDSFNFPEDCVDPLEFLEVDQSSVDGSTDGIDSVEAENSRSEGLSDNVTDVIKHDVPEQVLPVTAIKTVCKKCGLLKKPLSYSGEELGLNAIGSFGSEEKQVFCMCVSNRFKCKLCKQSIKKSCYDYHMQRHDRARNYKCDVCGKLFLQPYHLKSHMSIHEEDRQLFVCDICNKEFKMEKSLKYHRLSCSKNKFYRCNKCGESFSIKKVLYTHLKKHEEEETVVKEESFNCEICCIMFDDTSSKKDHIMQVHVEAQRFVCASCGEAFVTECAMQRHKATHTRSYQCKVCDLTFLKKRELLVHNIQHRSSKDLRCQKCDREFEQVEAYMEHKLSQSCNSEETVCEQCNKTFKGKTALRKHLIVHIPVSERSVPCDICSKSFCGIPALKKHVRLFHTDRRPYTCEFCSKSFNQLCKLKYHIVIHASDKPVACEVCNKKFSNDKDIRIHMRTHTGEKPFSCKICGKKFRQRGHVKSHQLVHTKEKPFSCQVCKRGFGLSSSLKKHMKLHLAGN